MEEAQVTVDGDTHPLLDPFFVVATLSPVDMEGTFELPEAQVDRFLVKTAIGYPDQDGEVELLRRRRARTEMSPNVEPVLEAQAATALRETPESFTVDDDLLKYQAALALAMREHHQVEVGVSPRGTQRLFEAARARAVISGRKFVTPEDVTRVAEPVLAHRFSLTADARVDGVPKSDVVAYVVEETPVPTV
jgi:MoxR-like ATPase